jgi:branched-chain amino acid transport system permease protein
VNQVAGVLVGALAPAAIYSLIAVGFVLIFRATRVFNFAQGQFVFIGALLFVSAYERFHSFAFAVILAIAVTMVLGAAMYMGLMRPLTGQGVFTMVMVTLILGTAILNGIIAIIWGYNIRPFNMPVDRRPIALPFGTHTDRLDLATIAVAAVVIGAFALFLRRSRFGIEMRAAAGSPILASYAGVNIVRTANVSWAVAFAMATLAGIATAVRMPVDYHIIALGAYTFPAIILGGMDSVIGALVGSYLLAVVQGATATFVPQGGLWVDVSSYFFMLVVLMIRPYGLFGTKEFRRL